MKRATAFTLFAALVLGLLAGIPMTNTTAATLDADGNEVTNLMEGMNPSFEDFTIPNWTFCEGAAQTTDKFYGNGGWSLKLADKDATKSIWALNEKTAIDAGEKYTISVQTQGGIGVLTAFFYKADGTELTDSTIVITAPAESDDWQMLAQDFIAPEDATHIALQVSSTTEGTKDVFFDAVCLSAEPKPPVESILVNGDLDEPWTGKMAPGWTNTGAAGTKYEQVPNGDGYAMALTKASGAGYTFKSQMFDVEPGVYYTASVEIKLQPGTACGLYLRMVDANGNQIVKRQPRLWVTSPTVGM